MVPFSPQQLLAALKQIPFASRYWVAYSGGLDSHVLLHALTSVRGTLDADINVVHINHGLSKDADAWARHCEAVCSALCTPYFAYDVNARPDAGESPEAAARRARYAVLTDIVQTGDCVLTAHHQDDQAETVLLQMLRGAGPRGLAAMPLYVEFSHGMLGRPLLGFTREQLHDYALQEGLHWINDQSNFDTGYQRNYLRHEVLPTIKSRWPAVARVLSRSAAHCADAAHLIDVMGAADLAKIRGPDPNTLYISELLTLDEPNQRNVLRFWIRQLGVEPPETVHLDLLNSDVLDAADDKMPLLTWAGAEIRRYRDVLYVMPPLFGHDLESVMDWNMSDTPALPWGTGRLYARRETGKGLNAAMCQSQGVTVRYRQGGETCRPVGDNHTRSVKKLFQQRGIPPWQRDRIPFIYVGDTLAAVADLWLCQPYQAGPDEIGYDIEWLPGDASKNFE